jgi:pilus assembly protein Flp/PilA
MPGLEFRGNELAKGLPMTRWARALLRSETGATAIEYALVASLISIAILVGATAIGTNLSGIFSTVASGI